MIKKASLNWISILLLFGLNNLLWAQNSPTSLSKTPEWTITLDKKNVKVGDEITATFTSLIEKDWYMYSNDFDPNLGPIAAEFTWEKHASYQLIGKPTPVGAHKHYEEVWKGDVSVFKKKAVFKQKIKILSDKPVIKGSIYFQECNEISGICMPPFDVAFDVKVIVLPNTEGAVVTLTPTTENIDTTNNTSTQVETSSIVTDTTKQVNNTEASAATPPPATTGIFSFLLIAFLGG
jgi:thiol:disulfide interchange protein DsbD